MKKLSLTLLALLAMGGLAVASDCPVINIYNTYFSNAQGHTVGEVTLRPMSQGVLVTVTGNNFSQGWHGFHFHAVGSCVLPDFKSAGGHFNPASKDHGFKVATGAHAGDMPNIYVGANGKLDAEFLVPDVSLVPDAPNSLLDADGSAIVIHGGKDDYMTQPAGDAGARVACAALNKG